MKKRIVFKRGKFRITKNPSYVTSLSKRLLKSLKPLCKKIGLAGSIRRKEPKPVDIDIVLIPKNRSKIIDLLKKKGKFLQGGEKRASFKIEGVKTELYFTNYESWGATLLAYSSRIGSAIGLRIVSRKKGFLLNQYGLYDRKTRKLIAGKTEADIYKALGRQYKKPEDR